MYFYVVLYLYKLYYYILKVKIVGFYMKERAHFHHFNRMIRTVESLFILIH